MDIGRILPTEAAAILNVSPQFVRVAMQQGKLRINRIRLEFKDIYALYAKDAVVVLIESDWNLKTFTGAMTSSAAISINRIRLEFKASSAWTAATGYISY